MVGVDDHDDDDDHVGKAESTRCTLQLYQMWFQMIGVRSSKSLRQFTIGIHLQCTMCRLGSFKCVRLKSDADSSKFPYFLILKS